MAPHRVLETHDILFHILQHFGPSARSDHPDLLDVDPSVAPGKQWKTLARCARVSKAFSEPASGLLWRELPSLLPLLSLGLLPLVQDRVASCEYMQRCRASAVQTRNYDSEEDEDFYLDSDEDLLVDDSDESHDSVNLNDNFDGVPSQKGLQRFSQYATLVRRISLPELERIDTTVFFHLSRANPGHPLLPMVVEIRCRVSPVVDMTVLSLAGKSLRVLVILEDNHASWNRRDDSHEAFAVRRLLGALPSRTPELRTLCVYDQGKHTPSQLTCIGQLRELRSFRMKSWSKDLWVGAFMYTLATLEHLHDLALPLDNRWIPQETPIQEGFRELRRLRFDGYRHKDLLLLDSLAAIMPSIQLERLDVIDAFVNSFEEERSCFDTFAAACADTLTTLRFVLHVNPDEELYTVLSIPVPAFNIFRPLVQLHHLQVCRITFSDHLSFVDDDLNKIQGVWPHLQVFALSWKRSHDTDTAPSFRDVMDFLRQCPRLAVFKLSAVVILGQVRARRTVKALPLNFVVKDKHIRDPVTFADALRSLFPRVRVDNKTCAGASGKWARVLSRLRDT